MILILEFRNFGFKTNAARVWMMSLQFFIVYRILEKALDRLGV